MTDFYQRGQDLGMAYSDGQDLAARRERAAADLQAVQAQTQRVQGITQGEQAARDQAAGLRSDLGAAFAPTAAPAGGVPTPGVVDPNTGMASDPNTQDPNAPPAAFPVGASAPAPTPAPVAGPKYQSGQGDHFRALASAYGRAGLSAQSDAYMQKAQDADKTDVYNVGAAIADDPKKRDAALRMVNQKDPSLTVAQGKDGMYRMTMVSPDGTAHEQNLNENDIRHLMGAQALMEHGYVQDALPLFGQVDARLAATIATRNAANTQMGTFNNKATIDSQNSDAKMTLANAAADKADAYTMRAEASRAKLGPLVNAVGKDGAPILLQTVMNSDGSTSYSPVNLPAGARMPKQVDPKVVESVAANMIGQPTGRTGEDGKPEKYDAATAYRAAYQAVAGDQSPAGGGFQVPTAATPDAAAAAAKAAGKPTGGIPAGPSMQDRARAAMANTPMGRALDAQRGKDTDAAALDAFYKMHPNIQRP